VERTRLQRSTFLVLFALALYGFWRTLEPIWVPVLLGLVIAVAVHPLQEKWMRRMRRNKRPGLSAALLTTLVMVSGLAVLAFLVFVVGHRAIDVAEEIAGRYRNKGAVGLLGGEVSRLLGQIGLDEDALRQRISETAGAAASAL